MNTRTYKYLTLILVVFAGALLFQACGTGSSDDDDSTSQETSTDTGDSTETITQTSTETATSTATQTEISDTGTATSTVTQTETETQTETAVLVTISGSVSDGDAVSGQRVAYIDADETITSTPTDGTEGTELTTTNDDGSFTAQITGESSSSVSFPILVFANRSGSEPLSTLILEETDDTTVNINPLTQLTSEELLASSGSEIFRSVRDLKNNRSLVVSALQDLQGSTSDDFDSKINTIGTLVFGDIITYADWKGADANTDVSSAFFRALSNQEVGRDIVGVIDDLVEENGDYNFDEEDRSLLNYDKEQFLSQVSGELMAGGLSADDAVTQLSSTFNTVNENTNATITAIAEKFVNQYDAVLGDEGLTNANIGKLKALQEINASVLEDSDVTTSNLETILGNISSLTSSVLETLSADVQDAEEAKLLGLAASEQIASVLVDNAIDLTETISDDDIGTLGETINQFGASIKTAIQNAKDNSESTDIDEQILVSKVVSEASAEAVNDLRSAGESNDAVNNFSNNFSVVVTVAISVEVTSETANLESQFQNAGFNEDEITESKKRLYKVLSKKMLEIFRNNTLDGQTDNIYTQLQAVIEDRSNIQAVANLVARMVYKSAVASLQHLNENASNTNRKASLLEAVAEQALVALILEENPTTLTDTQLDSIASNLATIMIEALQENILALGGRTGQQMRLLIKNAASKIFTEVLKDLELKTATLTDTTIADATAKTARNELETSFNLMEQSDIDLKQVTKALLKEDVDSSAIGSVVSAVRASTEDANLVNYVDQITKTYAASANAVVKKDRKEVVEGDSTNAVNQMLSATKSAFDSATATGGAGITNITKVANTVKSSVKVNAAVSGNIADIVDNSEKVNAVIAKSGNTNDSKAILTKFKTETVAKDGKLDSIDNLTTDLNLTGGTDVTGVTELDYDPDNDPIRAIEDELDEIVAESTNDDGIIAPKTTRPTTTVPKDPTLTAVETATSTSTETDVETDTGVEVSGNVVELGALVEGVSLAALNVRVENLSPFGSQNRIFVTILDNTTGTLVERQRTLTQSDALSEAIFVDNGKLGVVFNYSGQSSGGSASLEFHTVKSFDKLEFDNELPPNAKVSVYNGENEVTSQLTRLVQFNKTIKGISLAALNIRIAGELSEGYDNSTEVAVKTVNVKTLTKSETSTQAVFGEDTNGIVLNYTSSELDFTTVTRFDSLEFANGLPDGSEIGVYDGQKLEDCVVVGNENADCETLN